MVVSELSELDRRFRALADPTRRDIVARTMRDECAVSDLAAAYPLSVAAVQRPVAVLEAAGLVTTRAAPRHRFVRARPDSLDEVRDALAVIAAQWHDRVERMHAVLEDEPGGTE